MKEIDECQCPTAGYCEFFRQEMTYDPPNWQWCQGAGKEERNKYKIDCIKKHDRKKLVLDGKYITNQQLIKDCVDYLLDISVFVGKSENDCKKWLDKNRQVLVKLGTPYEVA